MALCSGLSPSWPRGTVHHGADGAGIAAASSQKKPPPSPPRTTFRRGYKNTDTLSTGAALRMRAEVRVLWPFIRMKRSLSIRIMGNGFVPAADGVVTLVGARRRHQHFDIVIKP